MIFTPTELDGAYVIDPERMQDERGFFARTFCEREFRAHGLNPRLVQCSVSFNRRKGTWRGLHLQLPPHEEAKLVRCGRGAIHDVILDLRRQSRSFKRHVALELSAENGRLLYVPEGFAHGFQTLQDDTEVCYQMSEFQAAESARGFRWDDPAFGIHLPLEVTVTSARDRSHPDSGL